MEKEIEMQTENVIVYSGGGAVNSVNGYTGDVILTTSDLQNTSDYQTSTQVQSAITTAISGKQDTLIAGANITITNNVISAVAASYTAGNGINISNQNVISADTTVLATQQDVTNEATARENADINLQGQIDALSAASDVTDVVGTYADLQNYDTQHLKDNDIIKVLQDESQDDATTYYRWNITTQSFTLIGQEGPYYTKSEADLLLADKQNTLTAGSNITIAADNTISATDTTYSAGSGLDLTDTTFSVDTTTIQPKLTAGNNIAIDGNNEISATDTTYSAGSGIDLTGTTFSVNTTTIQPKLTAGANITIDGNNEISATDTTYSNFVGTDGVSAGVAGLVPAPATTDAGKFLKADGTWDTAGGSSVNVVQTTGQSTADVMSQKATTDMVFSPTQSNSIAIGPSAIYPKVGAVQQISIGYNSASGTGINNIAIGSTARCASGSESIAIGQQSYTDVRYSMALGKSASANGDSAVALGAYAQTHNTANVAVGAHANNSTESGVYTTALGGRAQTGGNGSIAMGAYSGSTSLAQGEMNIGSSNTDYGYNNTNYRLISGLYDPQSAHDAATKGYVDAAVIQSGTSAPTTSTAATVGALMATVESGTGHLYICTDDTGGTYTWQTLV